MYRSKGCGYTVAIGDFSGCVNMESIRIPASVKNVSGGFDNCPKLLSVTWPHLADNISSFPAYYGKELERRRAMGLCLYCGGEFKMIGKTCKVCGKKKDY